MSCSTVIARTSVAFISFTYFLGFEILALDDLRLDGQLVAGQTQGLAGDLFGNTGDLKHDTAGLDYCDPILGGTLTGTHAGLGRLLGDGLVGEDLDPDLTATLGIAGHGDTGGLDLIAGDPAGLQGNQTVLAVGHLIAAHGLAGEAATVYSAVLNSLRQKHY